MIRLELPLPCRLNAYYMGNGRQIVRTKEARVKTTALLADIARQLGGRPEPMIGPIAVDIIITPRDKRIPDVDAYCKHLLDLMTKAGVWGDDKQVVEMRVRRRGPQHPGSVTVEIAEI